MASSIVSLKLRGLTAAAATINTQDVAFFSDGTWRFTIGNTVYIYNGTDAAVNALLYTAFKGTGGFPANGAGAGFGNTGL
jgi:hypothetical protein